MTAGGAARRLRDLASRLTDLAMPHLCLHCGERAPWESDPALCAACAAVGWPSPRCPRCGQGCHERELDGGRCHGCRHRDLPWAGLQVLGPHRGWLRRAVLLHKFQRDRLATRWLRAAAAGGFRRGAEAEGPAAVACVPSHPGRLAERGWRVQHLPPLVADLARGWGLPVLPLLAKTVLAAPQVALDGDERRKAVAGTLAWTGPETPPATVHLVDDVFTTGTTMAEAARVLRGAGVTRVRAYAFAMSEAGERRGADTGDGV